MEFHWLMEGEILFRLILAVLLGGVVGMEREMHGRPAGFRTHIVVCLGAAVMMIATDHYQDAVNPGGMLDSNRMAAGIITGIGFLGAGAIMREENMVRGLTTAGCVWFVAGLGIVIGRGFYALSLWATLLVFVMLFFFRFVEAWMPVDQYDSIRVAMVQDRFEAVQKQCEGIFEEHHITIETRTCRLDNKNRESEIDYTVSFKKGTDHQNVLSAIARQEGVLSVEI